MSGGAAIVGAVHASGADPGPVIHACVGIGGAVRILDPDSPRSCRPGERATAWNQQGPQGQVGPQGQPGPEGRPGPQGPPAAGNRSACGDVTGAIVGSWTV